MALQQNQDVADRLDEVAGLLAEQGAVRFRVDAYRRAAELLRHLAKPVGGIFAEEGVAGLEKLPGIGESLARSIRDMLVHGRLPMLERLRGEHDSVALLRTVPGIGRRLAERLHEDLGIESLAALEAAAHDGRLRELGGVGEKRLAGIRDSLAHRLGRVRNPAAGAKGVPLPRVSEILDVDAEYREAAAAGKLKKIAPRRFNPSGEAWLPVLHTRRGPRHYTALYSNTARAHELGRTNDWVVLYFDGSDGEQQCTVITARHRSLSGRRIVRGREAECVEHYRASRCA